MHRCGITTVSSFREAIKSIPDNYFIGTNEIGNIVIYRPIEDGAEMIGYIELRNVKFFNGKSGYDCVVTFL